MGFLVIDTLAEKYRIKLDQHQHQALSGRGEVEGHPVVVSKAMTYMNKSGVAAKALLNALDIPPERMIVVHDEIDLPNGEAKIKWAGGHGGHNGLRSIFAHLSRDIWRLRLGVGHPGHKDQVVSYVLKQISKSDRAAIDDVIIDAMNTIDDCVSGDMEAAMRRLHTK